MSRLLLVVALLLALALPAAAAPLYRVTDLGALLPAGINDAGQIAGTRDGHAVRWEAGNALDLGAGTGSAINALGQVAGSAVVPPIYSPLFPPLGAVVWNGLLGLAPLAPALNGADSITVTALDDRGTAVGSFHSRLDEDESAVRWPAGGYLTEIIVDGEALAGSGARITDVAGDGTMVGFDFQRTGDGSPTHALMWNPTLQKRVLPNLFATGSEPSYGTAAFALNDKGTVAGQSGGLPVRWVRVAVGTWRVERLSRAPGKACAVNLAGQIVGTVTGRAFLWTTADGLLDLTTLLTRESGWTLAEAVGINAAGQIIGTGTLAGTVHGYLATPVTGRYRGP